MLPKEYSWLAQEAAPKMLVEALKLYGIKEVGGEEDNPIILAWAKETGIKNYFHDETAWCGLFMSIVAKRGGKEIVNSPLWALNWANFGEKVTDGAQLGDVLVFKRSGGGHVGLYIGEDDEAYHVLGGNQADSVSFTRIDKRRLYAVRRPAYKVKPPNVRKIILSDTGKLSENES